MRASATGVLWIVHVFVFIVTLLPRLVSSPVNPVEIGFGLGLLGNRSSPEMIDACRACWCYVSCVLLSLYM